ncbi:MAG: proteasome subunit alpha [Candidatus Methylacidiphilales bacterium]|nr:proteasome subunit alpha [Candidatus Methylacidiphilales bacterium]
MIDEPYRWLEAVQNRREYIEDRISGGLPLVAIAGTPGVLLIGPRASTPKIFEIYDRLALGCLGHPADLEKVRQAAIDAAHVEGFSRSPHDVTARRLVNYALGPALKNAFEQIVAAPLLFRGLLAELQADSTSAGDAVWMLEYDGTWRSATGPEAARGLLIIGDKQKQAAWEKLITDPALQGDAPADSWAELARRALRILAFANSPGHGKGDPASEIWGGIPTDTLALKELVRTANPSATLDAAVLDRALLKPNSVSAVTYRPITLQELGLA